VHSEPPLSTWRFKNEEFAADFELVAKRELKANTRAWELFRLHFLRGADPLLCMRILELDGLTFAIQVSEIEERLGRAFRELQPHPLYPVHRYFASK
jgi:hypothetical protein